MKAIRNFWESIVFSVFKPHLPLTAGVYHYQTPTNSPEQYRLHLRLNPSGDGLLIVNASTVLHLNQTAAEYAFYIVNQIPKPEAAQKIAKRYNVPYTQAVEDLNQLSDRIETLIHEQDLDPVTFFEFDEKNPYSSELTAPLRLDCALTYRYNGLGVAGLAPTDRVKAELSTQEWISILEKAWQFGIPQVIFTGGEPTLRPDLVELIAHSEKLGMVTGLLTSGINLATLYTLNQLLDAGLDHMMVLLDPASEESWQVVQTAVAADIFLTVHLTITPQNEAIAQSALKRMAELGVTNLSLSAVQSDLFTTLNTIRQLAAELSLKLITDLPVPYSQFHPVSLELSGESELPLGAGTKWLYLEPDGDVLPAQGVLISMGNLLSDSWEDIWSHRPIKK
jgi:organic radical activating enzyme